MQKSGLAVNEDIAEATKRPDLNTPVFAPPGAPAAGGDPNVYNFITDYGSPAAVKGTDYNGTVTADPNKEYVLVDERNNNNVLYRGTGAAGLAEVHRQAEMLSQTQGKKANWQVYAGGPGSDYTMVANEDPHKSPFWSGVGKAAAFAAPIAGAALGSLIPGLGTVLGASLGAAVGSGGVGVAKGESIGNILKDAAISGGLTAATAGLLHGTPIGQSVTKAVGSGLGSVFSPAASAATTNAMGDIVLTAGRGALPTALLSGAGSALGSGALNSMRGPEPNEQPDITVSGTKIPPLNVPAAAAAALPAALPAVVPDITVTGTKTPPPLNVPAAVLPGAAAAAVPDITVTGTKTPPPLNVPAAAATAVPGAIEDITVTGKHDPPTLDDKPLPITLPDISEIGNTDLSKMPTQPAGTDLKKLLSYVELLAKLGGLGAGLLGGSGGSSTYGGGASGGNISPIMHAALPTANLPGLTAGTTGARTMPAQDWTKYGMRPGQSFFNAVPSTYTPPAPGQYDQWDQQRPGYMQGYAEGGRVAPNTNGPSFYSADANLGDTGVGADAFSDYGVIPRHFAVRGHTRIGDVELALRHALGGDTSGEIGVPLEGGHFGVNIDPHGARASYHRSFARGGPLDFAPGHAPQQRGALGYMSDQPIIARGPGGGRGDKIPSMLSDGEYVMDAESVAMLGNGSIREGTNKLNDLRVNLRKHKGAALAKGKISPDAHAPARYMGAL